MKICVMGLGKLGAVVAAVYAEAGHTVVGFDTNEETISAIRSGKAPVAEPHLQALIDEAGSRLSATNRVEEAMDEAEVSIIIVPTPSTSDGSFSNAFVLSALASIGASLGKQEHLVVISSTVSPGSCDGPLRLQLESISGRQLGGNLGLVYSPEFIALGSVVRDMQFPELVLVGASDDRSAARAETVFRSVVRSEPRYFKMSLTSAEIAKLAVNTYVTTKISYANMIGELCDALVGASASDVLAAVGADSRIGGKYLKPALGYGGPCFPRDNRALQASAQSVGLDMEIAAATDTVNDRQVQRVIKRVVTRISPPCRIAVLGLSYKPQTPVCDESQGVKVANALASQGFSVAVHDPEGLEQARPQLNPSVEPQETLDAALRDANCIIVATPWEQYKQLRSVVRSNSPLIIDPWGIV